MQTRSMARAAMIQADNDAQHKPVQMRLVSPTEDTRANNESKEDTSKHEQDERKTSHSVSAAAADSSAADPTLSTTPTPPRDRTELQVLPSFLSAAECEHLIALTTAPSTHHELDSVVEARPGLVPFAPFYSAARTSSHIVLALTNTYGAHLRDPVVAAVIDRAAQLAQVPSNRLWDMKLIRYEPGQYFAPHLDNGPDARWNPSVRSFFVFLNTLPEGQGGETHFTKLDRRFPPVQGTALTWINCSRDGRVYFPEAEHQGCAPKQGTKYGLNFFFNLITP